MYQSFEAKNFRCFRDVTIKDLARVNLIAGLNNVGKTSLLEALFFHCGAYNPGLIKNLWGWRGIPKIVTQLNEWAEGPWASVFRDLDTSKEVKLAGRFSGKDKRTLQLRVIREPSELAKISASLFSPQRNAQQEAPPFSISHVLELEYHDKRREGKVLWILGPQGPFPFPEPTPAPSQAVFISARTRVPINEDVQRFSDMKVAGQLDTLEAALRIIEPDLQELSLLSSGGLVLIHAQVGGTAPMPLLFLGEGMVRITSLILAIGAARGGVVLVDEIENGLHHSVLVNLWRAIAEAARKFDVQVFATTHSWECISAAHNAFSASKTDDLALHRLDRAGEETRAVAYDRETLEAAIQEGFEVR